MTEDEKLKQAKELVKKYSVNFTRPQKVSDELQKFANAKSTQEKEQIFNSIIDYGSVFKNENALRAELNQLFDKQQDVAVNKVTTAAKKQTEITRNNTNNSLEAAKQIVEKHSLFFEPNQSFDEALKRFAITQNSQERDRCFEAICRLGNVPDDKLQSLRAELNQLFDKQQDVAVDPIQPNKAGTAQTEPIIVEINKRKYAVCVQDNDKYLVGLENQATNAMISAYNTKNGINNLLSNNEKNISKITVNGESKDIFCGTITKGGKNSAGHVVGIVIHKDADGTYKTTVLDQTTYIAPVYDRETGKTTLQERSDAKKENQELYRKQIKQIHLDIRNQYPDIQFDENINFQHGVYPVNGNVASCSEVMAYFTDDLIQKGLDVNKALTYIKEEVSLPRMASMRFNATCAAMKAVGYDLDEAELTKIHLEQLNTIKSNTIVDDMGFLRKLTDAEYQSLTGIAPPAKTTQLAASPLKSQIVDQEVPKPENLNPQLPTSALQEGVTDIAKGMKPFISPPNAVTEQGHKTITHVVNVVHALNNDSELSKIMREDKAKEFQETTKLMTEQCQKGDIKGVQQGFIQLNKLCVDQPNIQNTSVGKNLIKVISSASSIISAIITLRLSSVGAKVQKFKDSVRNLVQSDHRFSASLSKTRGLDANNHPVNRINTAGQRR